MSDPAKVEAFAALKQNLRDVWVDDFNDDIYLYRFFKARQFDRVRLKKWYEIICVGGKNTRLMTCWLMEASRNAHRLTAQEAEVITRYYAGGFCGVDKEGHPVWYEPSGLIDPQGLARSVTREHLLRSRIYITERFVRQILPEMRRKTGLPLYSCTFVIDLTNYGRRHPVGPGRLWNSMPSSCKSASRTIRKQSALRTLSMRRRFFQSSSICSNRCYTSRRRRRSKSFSIAIDADELPKIFGGNRTDPDGDPHCPSMICWGGDVPKHYYLKPNYPERLVSQSIGRRSTHRVELSVPPAPQAGQWCIEWDFLTDDGDLGFEIVSTDDSESPLRHLPLLRRGGPCPQSADSRKYTVCFDNAFSRIRSKRLRYFVHRHRQANRRPDGHRQLQDGGGPQQRGPIPAPKPSNETWKSLSARRSRTALLGRLTSRSGQFLADAIAIQPAHGCFNLEHTALQTLCQRHQGRGCSDDELVAELWLTSQLLVQCPGALLARQLETVVELRLLLLLLSCCSAADAAAALLLLLLLLLLMMDDAGFSSVDGDLSRPRQTKGERCSIWFSVCTDARCLYRRCCCCCCCCCCCVPLRRRREGQGALRRVSRRRRHSGRARPSRRRCAVASRAEQQLSEPGALAGSKVQQEPPSPASVSQSSLPLSSTSSVVALLALPLELQPSSAVLGGSGGSSTLPNRGHSESTAFELLGAASSAQSVEETTRRRSLQELDSITLCTCSGRDGSPSRHRCFRWHRLHCQPHTAAIQAPVFPLHRLYCQPHGSPSRHRCFRWHRLYAASRQPSRHRCSVAPRLYCQPHGSPPGRLFHVATDCIASLTAARPAPVFPLAPTVARVASLTAAVRHPHGLYSHPHGSPSSTGVFRSLRCPSLSFSFNASLFPFAPVCCRASPSTRASVEQWCRFANDVSVSAGVQSCTAGSNAAVRRLLRQLQQRSAQLEASAPLALHPDEQALGAAPVLLIALRQALLVRGSAGGRQTEGSWRISRIAAACCDGQPQVGGCGLLMDLARSGVTSASTSSPGSIGALARAVMALGGVIGCGFVLVAIATGVRRLQVLAGEAADDVGLRWQQLPTRRAEVRRRQPAGGAGRVELVGAEGRAALLNGDGDGS
uniref:GOLD domain-containing protein n=1 Tax=Macrostomum lignano TaxID=282301 RepID=A0A1I8JL41_9PLAT